MYHKPYKLQLFNKQMIKNLLTSILLAGGSMIYGQNSNDSYKKISELYGEKGERIEYKDYSKIPWQQLDTNEIKINNLEEIVIEQKVKNKESYKDTIFSQAKKLGYDKEKIKNLSAKEAIELAISIDTSRYEYCLTYQDSSFIKKHGKDRLSEDEYFSIGLGKCNNYSESFKSIINELKTINKNLKNVYAINKEGRDDSDWRKQLNHAWNQLILLTKDSLYFSDIDITNCDANKGNMLEAKYFDFEDESKTSTLIKLYHQESEIIHSLDTTLWTKIDNSVKNLDKEKEFTISFITRFKETGKEKDGTFYKTLKKIDELNQTNSIFKRKKFKKIVSELDSLNKLSDNLFKKEYSMIDSIEYFFNKTPIEITNELFNKDTSSNNLKINEIYEDLKNKYNFKKDVLITRNIQGYFYRYSLASDSYNLGAFLIKRNKDLNIKY